MLTNIGEIQEHIFNIRSIDNGDMRSNTASRTFFRSNQAPNAPKIRWAESDTSAYFVNEAIPDTQLVGDTITIVYSGIRLLWQGSDPDSRSTNVIPLEFSYALLNAQGDSIPLPVRNDSNQVVGTRAGWSNWSSQTQISMFGLETGDYTFYLRVRDDGFTLADTMATCTFSAVKPTLSRAFLIVDENKIPSAIELARGGIHSDTLMAVYRGADGNGGIVRTAIEIANAIAPFAQPPGFPPIRHFDYDSVAWLDNRAGNPLPYAYISQFAAIWVIDDDNVQNGPSGPALENYNKVLSDYMNIGGNVMLTGRRLFNKKNNLPSGSPAVNEFLRTYFNIFSVRPKEIFGPTQGRSGLADFAGAVASDPQYPDLNMDTTMLARLRYGASGVSFYPEIEYFGRSNAPVSFDFATTIYNYKSSTSDTLLFPNIVENYDCGVDQDSSTATIMALIPQNQRLPVLSASRIYNRTRDVFGDYVNARNLSTNSLEPRWRIFASIPAAAGRWDSTDVLEVTYRFIPLSADHDEPIALNFVKYTGTIDIEIDGNEVRTRVSAKPTFRSCLFAFPLVYMKNELYTHPLLGDVPALSLLIANQLLFFNQNLDVNFN